MASANALMPLKERGPLSGLSNMLRKEVGLWWQTRRWWIQGLVWFLILNGVVAATLWLTPLVVIGAKVSGSEGLNALVGVTASLVPLGVMILSQSAVVSEKQSGTAAWLMASPISRISFVLAKFLGNAIGILVLILGLQGGIAYLQSSLRDLQLLPVGPFLSALGLLALNLFFYLALSLMLGTFFRGRGPVIGISLAFYFAQSIAAQLVATPGFLEGKLKWLEPYLPNTEAGLASAVLAGQRLGSLVPIISIVVLTVLFLGVAMWRFGREEF